MQLISMAGPSGVIALPQVVFAGLPILNGSIACPEYTIFGIGGHVTVQDISARWRPHPVLERANLVFSDSSGCRLSFSSDGGQFDNGSGGGASDAGGIGSNGSGNGNRGNRSGGGEGPPRSGTTPYEERYRIVYDAGGDRFYPMLPSTSLEKFLADISIDPGKALIVGCGEGRNIGPLASRGWRVVGIDSAPSGLERAARHYSGNDNITFMEADALKPLPLKTGSVDMVVVIEFLHLIINPNDRAFLMSEVFRVLREGGKIFFENNGRLNALEVVQLKGGYVESRTIQTREGKKSVQLERLPTVMLNGAVLRREIEDAGLIVDEMLSGSFQHPDTVREQIIVRGHKP